MILLPHRFDAYVDLLKSSAASSKYVTLDFIAQNSIDKEVARSINGDIKLIAISIFVFITVGVLLLTRCDLRYKVWGRVLS